MFKNKTTKNNTISFIAERRSELSSVDFRGEQHFCSGCWDYVRKYVVKCKSEKQKRGQKVTKMPSSGHAASHQMPCARSAVMDLPLFLIPALP